MITGVADALRRCRLAALTVFVTYLLSGGAGLLMVHAGSTFALTERDRIVHKAVAEDKASVALRVGNEGSAIVADFTGNVSFVLLLQWIAFSLSIGAGVRCGLELYRRNADIGWQLSRVRLPREGMLDVCRVYAITIPLFFAASTFEFLSPWNV